MTKILEMRDIRKSFGSVHALRGVDFSLERGEITALLGDNGDINFVLNLRAFLRNKCLKDAVECYQIEYAPEYEYVYAYFESGMVGMLRYWLANPQDGKTPEEVAGLIELLFSNGISCYSNVLHTQSTSESEAQHT